MLFALSPLSKRNTATNADGCVTTCIFQGATEDVLLRLEKRKKPLCCTDCCVVAVQKGVHTHQDRRATVHIRSVGLPGSAWDMAVMGAAGLLVRLLTGERPATTHQRASLGAVTV